MVRESSVVLDEFVSLVHIGSRWAAFRKGYSLDDACILYLIDPPPVILWWTRAFAAVIEQHCALMPSHLDWDYGKSMSKVVVTKAPHIACSGVASTQNKLTRWECS